MDHEDSRDTANRVAERRHRVVVVDDPALAPSVRLTTALNELLLDADPADVASPGKLGTAIIVPELGGFTEGSPAATDPGLVETLVDVLYDRGHTSVIVGAGVDESINWADNRDAYALVDLLGYRYVTPSGREYDVVDLSDDLIAAPFVPGDALHGVDLNASWIDAERRIIFASNVTHDVHGFQLSLGTCLRLLPAAASPQRFRPGDIVSELLQATPVDIALIDGVVSGHGSGGQRAPVSITTDTIIASDDVWSADTVGAIKMGLDPSVSPLFERAPARRDFDIRGSLAVYDGFDAPHSVVIESMSRLSGSRWAWQLISPWLQVLDPELFPLKSPLDAAMNERISAHYADLDTNPLVQMTLVALSHLSDTAQRSVDAYHTMYAKDEISRRTVPLGFDPDGYPAERYRSIVPQLETLARLLDGTESRGPNLRWRYLDDAILFDYRRILPIAFDDFVAHVDVARTISYMNDYLGGVVVELEWDDEGRSVRQAERNLYLPQPNYLILAGGEPIDVGKLEVVEYGTDRHRLLWETIESQNGSATYDDGIVTFERIDGGTAVTIFGRQLFRLPPLWQAVDQAFARDLKAHLVTDAYQVFFDRTLANLEALTESRDIRIGRWPDPEASARPVIALEQLAERAIDRLHSIVDSMDQTASDPNAATMIGKDEFGFTHWRATPHTATEQQAPLGTDAASFWLDLVEAGLRDSTAAGLARRS